jgi:hypothetical protein
MSEGESDVSRELIRRLLLCAWYNACRTMGWGAAAVSKAARGVWLAGGSSVVKSETGASPLKIEDESRADAGKQRLHKRINGGDAIKGGRRARSFALMALVRVGE